MERLRACWNSVVGVCSRNASRLTTELSKGVHEVRAREGLAVRAPRSPSNLACQCLVLGAYRLLTHWSAAKKVVDNSADDEADVVTEVASM